jgi:hypothetical protein
MRFGIARFATFVFSLQVVGCSKPQRLELDTPDESKPNVKEKKGIDADVSSLKKSEIVEEIRPLEIFAPIPPKPLQLSPAFSLKQPKIALASSKPFEISWLLDSDLPDLDVFSVTVLDQKSNLILQQEVNTSSLVKGTINKLVLDFPLKENIPYTYLVAGYNKDRSYFQPVQGSVLFDTLKPSGRVYFSEQKSVSSCMIPMTSDVQSSANTIFAKLCVDDESGQGSGIDKICLLQNSSDKSALIPEASDSCWSDVSAFSTKALLSSNGDGLNYFHLFLKDKAGNIGRDVSQLVKYLSVDTSSSTMVSVQNKVQPVELSSPKMLLGSSQPTEISWILNSDNPDLEKFVVLVKDPTGSIVSQQDIVPISKAMGSLHKTMLDFGAGQSGSYKYSVRAILKSRAQFNAVEGTVLIDTVPPVGRVYLGTLSDQNACSNPPTVNQYVSTRVIPVRLCLNDQNGQGSGVERFCLIQNSREQNLSSPVSSHACWKEATQSSTEVLLSTGNNGVNFFHLFIVDKAGNFGRDVPQVVKLAPSEPPSVKLLSPTSVELASSKWQAGQEKILKWKVSDLDTPPLDIHNVVLLVNADNREDFKTLGCSFSDAPSAATKLCPDARVASSPSFVRRSDGTGEFKFKIENNWDLSKTYALVISAIDKAGNATVVSTSEINADWEVISGQSYNGFGGTGSNLIATESAQLIATDKLGQLYNTSAHRDGNTKIRAVDGRSCRFLKGVGKPATSFDCNDIIESDESVLGAPWVYIENRDSFYVAIDGSVKEIDFGKKTIKKVMGIGTSALPVGIEQKPMATIGKLSEMNSELAYESKSKSTFFMAGKRLYRIDSNQMVSFVVGSGSFAKGTPIEETRKPSELDLPQVLGTAIVVTSDGRLVYSSAPPIQWTAGSGYGLVYVVDGIVLGNMNSSVTLKVLGGSSVLSGTGPTQYSKSSYWSGSAYSEKENAIYFSGAWTGLYKLNLPVSGSSEELYSVEPVLSGYSAKGYDFFSYRLSLVPNTSLIYMSDSMKGLVLQVDSRTKTFSYVTGVRPMLVAGDRVPGDSATLASPRYFDRVSDSDIYFTDNDGLKRAQLDPALNEWSLTLLNQASDYTSSGPVRIFETLQKAVRTTSSSLKFVSLPTATTKISEVNSILPLQAPIYYPLQFGHSNSSQKPKLLTLGTSWDGKAVGIAQLFVVEYDPIANTSQKSDVNLISLQTLGAVSCGASKTEICQQSKTLVDSRGASYFAAGSYRVPQESFFYYGNNQQTVASFSADDKVAYTCGGKKFIAIELESKKIFEFEAKGPNGEVLSCPVLGASFFQFNGDLLYSVKGQFYKLNLSEVFIKNQASFVQMTYGKFPSGFRPNQFQVVSKGVKNWLYITDLQSQRLLRKEVSP